MEKKDELISSILAIAVTAGFFALVGFLALFSVPESNKEVLYILVGVLGTGWTLVITYFFGSSAGSKRKSNIIESLKIFKKDS